MTDPKSKRADRRPSFGGRTRRLALAAALLVAGTAGAAAQFYPPGYIGPGPFGNGPFGPGFGPPRFAPPMFNSYSTGIYIERRSPGPRFLHPIEITRQLESEGFRDVDVLRRNGAVFVVNALSPRREPTRLIIDAYDGEIVERFVTGSIEPRRQAPIATPRGTSEPKQRTAPPVAQLPAPPRRPEGAAPAAPRVTPPPVARRPSDWAPINSVPPAPLD